MDVVHQKNVAFNNFFSFLNMYQKKVINIACVDSKIEKNDLWYGKFQIGPFEVGQGLTVANALRRTLIADLSSIRIIAIQIEGVTHEYSTLSGMNESVLDLLLNLKKIIFSSRFQYNQPQIGFLKIKGPGVVTARHLKLPTSIQIVNPDQYIATLSYTGSLNIKLFICQGKNYYSFESENNKIQIINDIIKTNFPLQNNNNFLPIDNTFTPVIKVNYILKNYNLSLFKKKKEKIILEVWTNGSIHPKQAIQFATKKLVQLFVFFYERTLFKSLMLYSFPNLSIKIKNKQNIQFFDIGNLDLSLRAFSCLKKANINTIGELIEYTPEDLLVLKNFGKRSLEEVQFRLNQIGFALKKTII